MNSARTKLTSVGTLRFFCYPGAIMVTSPRTISGIEVASARPSVLVRPGLLALS